jgi:ATP-dependent DNA helicase RecG
MSTELSVAAAAPDTQGLPLEELDRLLRPLRRVLAFVMRDVDHHVDQVRFLEVNAGRWLAAARRLDVPEAVRELLDEVSAALSGYDSAADGRRDRLRAMYASLTRLDAMLGLPLDGSAKPPLRTAGFFAEAHAIGRLYQTEVEDGEPDGELEIEVEAALEEGEDRRWRLGDPAHTGRALAALDVDPTVAAALAEEGVETIGDLLLLAPSGEEVLRPLHGAGREIPPGRVAVGGRVRRRLARIGPDGIVTEVLLQGAGPLRCSWKGVVDVERFAPGVRVVLVGDLEVDPNGEPILREGELAHAEGHVVRLQKYGVENVSDAVVRELIARWLPDAERLRDPVDADLLRRLGLPSLGEAIRDLHLRGSGAPKARERMAFDEALLLQLGLASPRFQAGRERGIAHAVVHGLTARVCQHLEIEPNDGQQLALEDIKRDLREQTPMLRVLTGQAGAGKSLVAMLAAIAVAESKSQVMVLAPDPLSAELRFLFADPILREVGLVGRLVLGEPNRAQRDAIRRGEVHVVFGSLDLLDRELEFRRLGLVVAEERDAYGRAPARVAALRPPRPDLLVMVANPVPAAVLLSAYGDHDLSVVDELPHPVSCAIFPDSKREEAYKKAAEAVRAGAQAIVVFPMAKAPPKPEAEGRGEPAWADVIEIRSAVQVVEALATEVFPRSRVALFHGSMSKEERQRVYDDFRHRRCDVLIATTPIEDGPPVTSAAVCVVEQADRMGLSRLLRLRGHMAHAESGGELLLVTGQQPDAEGLERLEKIVAEKDGWAVAEWELGRRGLEPMLAREVPAAARLRWLDPAEDREILVWAREHALHMLHEDPSLRRGPHGDIARALRERWDDLSSAPFPLADGGAPAPKRRRRRRKKR